MNKEPSKIIPNKLNNWVKSASKYNETMYVYTCNRYYYQELVIRLGQVRLG